MYMAPEQAEGKTLDQRADLFSLGSVLYQMAAGHPPFRANSTVAVLKRVAEDRPRAIREIIPETPPWLCDIIAKLHAKNPEERFQSAREVADVLADCEAQLKANLKLKDFSRIPRSQPQRSGRRKSVAAAAVLLLSVIALAATELAGLTHLFQRQQRTTEPIPAGNAPGPAVAPFSAAQARAHQEAWAKSLGVPVEYTNSIGMKFVLIPPGEFVMGSTLDEIAVAHKENGEESGDRSEAIKSEAPQHKVILTQPFYLSVTEVTQAEYEKVNGHNPSDLAKTGPNAVKVAGLDTSNHPVEMVNWGDASEFCAKLSMREKLEPFKFEIRAGESVRVGGTGYRLPSEAEWEFACRAGTTTKYWTGDNDDDLSRSGWFVENARGRTHAAGELKANPFGLYDMYGNVWEWVADSWEPTYYARFTDKPAINPCCASGSRRVLRGNCWWTAARTWGRSSARQALPAGTRYRTLGFRAALAVDVVKVAKTPTPAVKTQAKGEPLPPRFTNSIGMEFVIVPKGKSWLGGGKDKLGDKQVEITADFYLGKYEVTQEEWEKVMGENPSGFSRRGSRKDEVKDIPDADLKRFPVELVSWDRCRLFVAMLNKMEKETGWVYRLPTEAEWEYACRGGPIQHKADSAFDFYFSTWTNTLLPEQANFAPEQGKGLQRPCKVGSSQANRLGLYDLHGNVVEVCEDAGKQDGGVAPRMGRGGRLGAEVGPRPGQCSFALSEDNTRCGRPVHGLRPPADRHAAGRRVLQGSRAEETPPSPHAAL
jgi:formylglycine-generating enzyme required for sulfatase activity